ncbi:hypothetical protein KUCAC02_004220 [Scomber scombrus]|uniref:Uncharacterized protein n=1 Tax=Scomber scombrus TaxID=13677 RepID=A0AAV1NWM3_SCOSC
MMTARFISGASLFALLIVDICCLPVKKGFNPSASHTNNAAPNAGVQREPAAHLSSSSSSGPALFGHWGHSFPDTDSSAGAAPYSGAGAAPYSGAGAAPYSGAGAAPYSGAGAAPYSGAGAAPYSGAGAAPYSGAGAAPYSGAGAAPYSGAGAARQPNLRDMNWAVAPLSTFSAGEERSAGAYGVGSSGPVNVSPAIYPPPPAYQAGEMSNLEEAFEHGNYETETEDQGFYSPPRPMQAFAGQAFTSQPRPGPGMGGYWGRYPYYDYMFVTGQYPPGTYTDFSVSNEQGLDNWEDAHYRRYYPAQVTKTSAVPQNFEDPRPAVKAPYGKGGAAAGRHNLGKILSFLHIRLKVIHQQLSIINSLGSDWSGLVFGNIYNPSHLTVSLLLAFNMMTARFFSAASLFALLIVDICCLPVKKGFNPSASHSNNNAAHTAGVQREPAAHLSSSSSSGPALFGHWGHSYPDADSSAHSGAAAAPYSGAGAARQPNLRDMNWAVAPLSTFSVGEERSAGAYGVGSSGPVNVSPAIYPPPRAYQAGEMSNLEEAFEHGNYETETEDQGFYSPPRPMQAFAGQAYTGQAFTSQPQPGPRMGGYWGRYPYYDYMFVTGQYPPGTYTDFSVSNEQGLDNWEDAHYRRYYPAQETKTSAVPQRFEDPRPAVKAPYGKGGAAAGRHNLGKILSFLYIRLRVIHQQLSTINSLGSDWSGLVFGNIYNPSHLTVSLLLAFNMMTARFFSGASLFALLIVDICCLPVKKGFNPSASHSNNNAAPTAGVQREPAAHLSSSSSSGPALFGHWGHTYPDADSSAHSGAAAAPYSGAGAERQPNLRDMNWAVAPLSTFSAGEERSAGAYGVGSSGPVNVSPAIYPPPPAYQAGEMSNLEEAFEHGNYETETEDQGFYSPPRPMQASAGQAFTGQAFTGQAFTSQPQPGPGMGGYWGRYPYYDYMFVTGQYPPGTYTDFSVSNEQGLDNWEDAHYRIYYPAQETKTSAVPQRFEDPRPAVKAPYGKGGAAAGRHNLGKGRKY